MEGLPSAGSLEGKAGTNVDGVIVVIEVTVAGFRVITKTGSEATIATATMSKICRFPMMLEFHRIRRPALPQPDAQDLAEAGKGRSAVGRKHALAPAAAH